jgi:hypothetical protein
MTCDVCGRATGPSDRQVGGYSICERAPCDDSWREAIVSEEIAGRVDEIVASAKRAKTEDADG